MSQPTTKGGNVILKALSVPSSVVPGETVTIEVEAANGALYINPFDPDVCGASALEGNGYELRAVLVHPDGSKEYSGWTCLGKTEIGTKSEFFDFTFDAPSTTGDHSYQAYVEMEGSGKTTDRVSQSLNVSEDAPTEPADDDDDSSAPGYEFPWDDIDVPDAPDAPSAGGLFDVPTEWTVIGVLLLVVVVLGAVS